MNVTVSRYIGKAIRTLGLMGIMMALAGLLAANATSASASTTATSLRTTSGSTAASVAATGKLTVEVVYSAPAASDRPATVLVVDGSGKAVAKGLTDSNGTYRTYLAPGTYKVFVYADGFKDSAQVVEIKSGQATSVKAELVK